MSRGQRTYSAFSDLEYRRDRVAEEDQHKATQSYPRSISRLP
uniref:Uncharacterized protein n=1 Tax=Leersia perrieri TaxID=77586 RepID=A0A0D9XZ86_9ORYZ